MRSSSSMFGFVWGFGVAVRGGSGGGLALDGTLLRDVADVLGLGEVSPEPDRSRE